MTAEPFWTRLKSISLNQGTAEPQRRWPEGASEEYMSARQALDQAQLALRDQVEEVARRRRELPAGPAMADYEFAEGPRDLEADEPLRRTTLEDLFGDHDTLVVYHMMFHPDDDEACPMCSLWVDGLHGVSHHLGRHTAFAVIAKAPLPKLRLWGRRRGWDGLRLLSSHETPFNVDMDVEGPKGGQWPAVSVFVRDGDRVLHSFTQSAGFLDGDDQGRGMDLLSPVWNVFDLLPDGRGDWLPENDYPARERG